ncbi:MAG: MFS transporter [Actinomycetota bacterium]|nr:MFS transporter [Actinomycetota bacterium]
MSRRRGRQPLPPGFAVVWTTVALDLVGFGIVLPILPIYARRFHASALEATLLVAAFAAASFLFSPLWGRIADRHGRKPVLLVSLVGTAVGSLVTGLAGGLTLLFVGRLIDGVSGASVSVAQATVADVADPRSRPRLFGLLGAAFGIGFVLGPAIGALGALAGPRVPFLIAAALAGVNALVAVRRLPETHPRSARHGHERGAHHFAALRTPGVVALISVSLCTLVAFSAFEATFALFGRDRLGLGIASSAATFAAVGAVIVIVQGGLVRPVVHRLGEVRTLGLGLLLDAVGLAVLAPARSWILAAPALVILTVGQGLVQTTMSSTLAGRADPRRRGEVLGAQQSAGGLARVIGPVLGGALLGEHATDWPYAVGAILVLVAFGVLIGTERPRSSVAAL